MRHIQHISFNGIFLEIFNKINCVNKAIESFCLVLLKIVVKMNIFGE